MSEYIRRLIGQYTPEKYREYITRMAEKESNFNPNAVSKTGAAGLLQFTRGTGRGYGLLGKQGDIRKDPVANIQAGVRLTEDNAKVLRGILGREPNNRELALAHQQGAQTAGRMIMGTGNASPQALAVNAVPAGASPQMAAERIGNYYFPPTGTPAAAPSAFPTSPVQAVPFINPENAQLGLGGISLATNPVTQGMAGSVGLGGGSSLEGYTPPSSNVPAEVASEAASGIDKGKFGEAMAGLEQINKAIRGGDAASRDSGQSLIGPDTMTGARQAQISQQAGSLMQAMLQNRRKNYGISLTG